MSRKCEEVREVIPRLQRRTWQLTYDAMIANSSSPGLCKTMNLAYNLMNTDMEASVKKIPVTIITASPEGLEPAMMYELSIQ